MEASPLTALVAAASLTALIFAPGALADTTVCDAPAACVSTFDDSDGVCDVDAAEERRIDAAVGVDELNAAAFASNGCTPTNGAPARHLTVRADAASSLTESEYVGRVAFVSWEVGAAPGDHIPCRTWWAVTPKVSGNVGSCLVRHPGIVFPALP